MSVRKKAVKEILEGVIKAGKGGKTAKPKRTYNTKKENDIRKAKNKAELDAVAKKKATPPPKRATDPKPPVTKKPPLQKVSKAKQTPKEVSKEGFDHSKVLPPNVKVTKIKKPVKKAVKTPAKKAAKKVAKKAAKKAVKKVPVKKVAKKAAKKAVKKPIKQAVKKPVKKPVNKPVKKPVKKPTQPKGVTGGAAGHDSKGRVIVLGGKVGDLKQAKQVLREKGFGSVKRSYPAPPKPTGPIQGPRGGKEAFEAYQKGRSYFRENFGKNVKKIAKRGVVETAKLTGKGVKASIAPAIAGGAVYYGMQSDSKAVKAELARLQKTVEAQNNKVTPSKPVALPTKTQVLTPKPKSTKPTKPKVQSPNPRTTPKSWKEIAKKYGYNI